MHPKTKAKVGAYGLYTHTQTHTHTHTHTYIYIYIYIVYLILFANKFKIAIVIDHFTCKYLTDSRFSILVS